MVDPRRRRLQELANRVGREAGVLPGGRRRDLAEGKGILCWFRVQRGRGVRVCRCGRRRGRLSEGPDQLTTGDVLELLSAGLDDEEILDAVHAAVLLETCNRVVSALGVEPMDPAQNRRAAQFLLHRGYDL